MATFDGMQPLAKHVFCRNLYLQIPIVLAPIWLLYGYVTPILDEYVNDADVAVAK